MCVTKLIASLGISRDKWHKRRATGGKRKAIRKKRKFELGRPAANTKVRERSWLGACTVVGTKWKKRPWELEIAIIIATTLVVWLLCVFFWLRLQLGQKRIHIVRTRGGNKKFRALRLDHGNYAWGSEGIHVVENEGILDRSIYNVAQLEQCVMAYNVFQQQWRTRVAYLMWCTTPATMNLWELRPWLRTASFRLMQRRSDSGMQLASQHTACDNVHAYIYTVPGVAWRMLPTVRATLRKWRSCTLY